MITPKIYGRLLQPAWWVGAGAVVIFTTVGSANLLGGTAKGLDDLAAVSGKPVEVKEIHPVGKKIDSTVKGAAASDQAVVNPFTEDHRDWQPKKVETEVKSASLNLEVLGITMIKDKTKALVNDLDVPNGKRSWLKVGETFKGYKVAYISRKNILLTGEAGTIKLALKSGKGKIYEGKGEIVLAPDIDLYLTTLKQEEVDSEDSQAEGTGSKPGAAAQSGRGDSQPEGNAGKGVTHLSGVGGGQTATAVASTTTATGGTGSSAGKQGTPGKAPGAKVDEMSFLLEMKKIFGKEAK